MNAICQQTLMLVSLIGLAVTGAVFSLAIVYPFVCKAWDSIGSRSAKTVFLLAVCLATLYGGSKHIIGSITYPRTDPETWYFLDNGSYVTNTYVKVKFTLNPVVPTTANIFVDGLRLDYTNQSDWATHSFNAYSNTIGQSGTDFNMPYSAATNYNWICYTDWTPPPVVHTNGVAYVAWQIGINKLTNNLAMTRTGVYTNAVRLAPNPAITNIPPIAATVTLTLEGENDNE